MFGLGPTELVVIIILALIVFGPSRLPKVGQSVGEMARNFRNVKESTGKIQDDMKKELEDAILGPSEKSE